MKILPQKNYCEVIHPCVSRACNAHYPARLWRNSSKAEFLYCPVFNDSACCLVCKPGSALTSKASSYLLNDDTYQCILRVIVSSIQTNGARCTLYKKILDLLDEESISGESNGRASLTKSPTAND